jgi:hypothetical protein
MKRLALLAVVACLGVCALTGAARAESLFLGSTGGGNTGVIPGAGGTVNFAGPLPGDAQVMVTVTTGTSTHNPDGTGVLEFTTVNVTVAPHSTTDTLYILLSDQSFGPVGPSALEFSIVGTLDPGTSLTAEGIADPANGLFGGLTPTVPPGSPAPGSTTAMLGPFTNPPPSGAQSAGAQSASHPFMGSTMVPYTAGPAPYSLTNVLTITFTQSNAPQTATASSTLQTSTAPEPASLTLVGIGAIGLLGYGWRRRRVAA